MKAGILVVVCLLTGHAFGSTCRHSDTIFRCVEYVRAYDGDTMTFNIPKVHSLLGRKISVRLQNVDAPERRKADACEYEKAMMAQKLVDRVLSQAETIDLVNIGRDKYFRIVADVVADGQSLSTLLLEKGLAVPYQGGTKTKVNWCLD